jgi:transcription elongation GreA/GreB family factor
MSRAFVKEQDGSDAVDAGPERPVPAGPNPVTAEGLMAIEAELRRLTAEQARAQREDDRAGMAAAARELRYWSHRRASAHLVAVPEAPETVAFGVRVTIARGDGRTETYRIVGTDEANPASGRLAWSAPLARALMGRSQGEKISFRSETIVIESIMV